jgi:chaperone required for assembly of F1-ATPase
MSFGTEFKADIYISRKVFTSIAEVQDYRDELKEEIVRYKSRLLMYVASNPKDIIPDEWKEEPIRWLQDESLELLSVIEENLNLLFKIDHLLEYLKENNIETIKN